jgi:hypothetical protein
MQNNPLYNGIQAISSGGQSCTLSFTAVGGVVDGYASTNVTPAADPVVINGGSGYYPGHVLSIAGGDGLGRVVVMTVTGTAVATVKLLYGGTGYVTRSPGTGCTFSALTVNPSTGAITNATPTGGASGTNYRVGDIINVVQSGNVSGFVKVATLSGTAVATVTVALGGLNYTITSATGVFISTAFADCNNIVIRDLMIGISAVNPNFGVLARHVTNLRMDNVWAGGFGAYDGSSGGGFGFDDASECVITGCVTETTYGSGFTIAGGAGDNTFLGCQAVRSGLDGSYSAVGIVPGWKVLMSGLEIPSHTNASWQMEGCSAADCSGSGFQINGNCVELTDCVAHENAQHGFIIGDTDITYDVSLHSCRAFGNSQFAPGDGNTGTYDGFHFAQATRPRLFDGQASGGGHRYGLYVESGTSGLQVFGGFFQSGDDGTGIPWTNASSDAFLLGPQFVPGLVSAYPVSYTLATMRSELQTRLGDDDGYQYTWNGACVLDGFIQQAYDRFLLLTMSARASLSLTAASGQASYPVAPIFQPTLVLYNGAPLDKKTEDWLATQGNYLAQTGVPTVWYQANGGSIGLFPTPDAAGAAIVVSGYATTTTRFTEDTDTANLLPAGGYLAVLDYAEMLARNRDPEIPGNEARGQAAEARFGQAVAVYNQAAAKVGK